MNTALWYTTRATGVVALVLLTITVVLGIAGVSKLESTRWPRLVTALLHKNISLLVTVFLAVHILRPDAASTRGGQSGDEQR
jgi:methionine sulfoxide reductase heme-binding subunit